MLPEVGASLGACQALSSSEFAPLARKRDHAPSDLPIPNSPSLPSMQLAGWTYLSVSSLYWRGGSDNKDERKRGFFREQS